MMTIEMVLAEEVVAGIIRERRQEAQQFALEREASLLETRRPSRLRSLLRFRLPRRAAPATQAAPAA